MPFFSWAQDFVLFHTCFYLANVSDEINFFRAGGDLCLRLQFRTRSDRQHELCNYLSFMWYSGLCFEILNLDKLSRLQKSLQNYPACKDATCNWIWSIPFLTWWTMWFEMFLCQWSVMKFSYCLFEVIRLFHGMWKPSRSYMWLFVVFMK